MCDFKDNFILCSCLDQKTELDFSWQVRRRFREKKKEIIKIIGQINIPETYKNISVEEFDSKIEEMIAFANLHKAKKIELRNTIQNIQIELNKRNCFDKEIEIYENDILSIKLDEKFKVWADFIYQQRQWNIYDINIDSENFKKINQGRIKFIDRINIQ